MAENQLDDAVEARAKREKQDTTDEDMYDDAEAELGSEDASIPATSPRHQQPTSPDHERTSRPLVRWSTSTEIGDFIREAARSHQFSLSIQSSTDDDISIPIAVPSFNDRTHYLRQRLRKTAGIIKDMAALKRECDVLAHRGGQRVALAGAGALVGYWYIVYRLTFETDLGWDTMEPVTVRTLALPGRDRSTLQKLMCMMPNPLVPSGPLDVDSRLSLVPVPQSGDLVPVGAELDHLAAAGSAIRTQGFRQRHLGSYDRGSQRLPAGD